MLNRYTGILMFVS